MNLPTMDDKYYKLLITNMKKEMLNKIINVTYTSYQTYLFMTWLVCMIEKCNVMCRSKRIN